MSLGYRPPPTFCIRGVGGGGEGGEGWGRDQYVKITFPFSMYFNSRNKHNSNLNRANRANSSDTEAPFLDLNLCISNGTVSSKIYDKRDDFNFDIVNIPFLDGDVPRLTSYAVYISQLIRFTRASSNLSDFNYRNKALTAKRLRQGYRYFKLRQTFSKFYRRHSALVEK